MEWHALYILLLAHSDAKEDHARIREAVQSNEKFGLTHQLAAWLTAWIEIDEKATPRLDDNDFTTLDVNESMKFSVKNLSSFWSKKDGKVVNGLETIKGLKGQRLAITLKKARELHGIFKKETGQ